MKKIFPILLCGFLAIGQITAQDQEMQNYYEHQKVIEKTADMVNNSKATSLVNAHGMNIVNVTWEDTGRYKGSSVGPNISDVTIQVQTMNPKDESFQLTCMPVIRYPNFSDKTADLSPNDFFLLVGNEKGETAHQVSLTEYLDNFRAYLSQPSSWKGKEKSLLAARDSHVLVSAQACFLPIAKGEKAEFNPVIFNYQSSQENPAVLTILATREGTSATIIDNVRDGFPAGPTWGQRLFYNKKGERAVLTGQRLSDFKKEVSSNLEKNNSTQPVVKANDESGLNMVLLIQVPLKHKAIEKYYLEDMPTDEFYDSVEMAAEEDSDVEEAVIGTGRVEGPFTEVDNLEIERDSRFPVRVTVQFYKATSNGVVSTKDILEIRQQIDKVYKNADYVGSLVTEGETGRPTEYEGEKFEPPMWWNQFWERHQKNTQQTPEQTIAMLKKLYGKAWVRMAESEDKFTEAVQLAQ